MRTDEEIIERVQLEEIKDRDMFSMETADIITRLPFEKVKLFIPTENVTTREDLTAEDWKPLPRDRESILKEMLEYMPFAWEKANRGRGLSAYRSMCHYNAWVWLAGDDLGDLTNYEYYGKDNLVKICRHYGWDETQWDDGIRENGIS